MATQDDWASPWCILIRLYRSAASSSVSRWLCYCFGFLWELNLHITSVRQHEETSEWCSQVFDHSILPTACGCSSNRPPTFPLFRSDQINLFQFQDKLQDMWCAEWPVESRCYNASLTVDHEVLTRYPGRFTCSINSTQPKAPEGSRIVHKREFPSPLEFPFPWIPIETPADSFMSE